MTIKAVDEAVDTGTTVDATDTGDGTTDTASADTSAGSEDAQSSEEDFWAEAVNSLVADVDEESVDSDSEEEEELPAYDVDAESDDGDGAPDQGAEHWKTQADKFDKMQRDTKRDHTKLSQDNSQLRKELDDLRSQIQTADTSEDEVDEDDPMTRGDVEKDFDRLYAERKKADDAEADKDAKSKQDADADVVFYDKVREQVPEYDTLIADPEFQDWHAQHKNWADATLKKCEYDDPSGMVNVVNRYKERVSAQGKVSTRKGQRLSRTMGPTGKGKPSSKPATTGDDFKDAVNASRKVVKQSSFTGFI